MAYLRRRWPQVLSGESKWPPTHVPAILVTHRTPIIRRSRISTIPAKKKQKTPKSLDDVTGCRQKKTMEYPLNVNCTFFPSHWKPTEPYLSILYWNCCQFLFTTNLWYRWGNSLDCLFLNSCGRTPFLSQIKSNPSIADDRLGICEIFLCADKTGQSKNAREHSSGKESTESRCWTRVEVNARNRRTFYPIRKKIFVAALQVERSIIFLKRD